MSAKVQGESLTQQDAKKLELSYKTLAGVQRKTLAFLNALGEYEKKRRQRGTEKASRLAFIVTPLMVNHYNHMHHVYRASVYGKVPDLCDQTGGIVCTDLGALREELATRTTDVNGPSGDTFRTATLPNVSFNFKAVRDNVLETSIRMLDGIDIKNPDLTHTIRDDYIQNVRAIQESLTSALEKARERSAELKTRLADALRKLNLAEKTMASAPGEAEHLRNEVFKLKEQVIKQQQLLLTQRIEDDNRALEMANSRAECKLLQDVIRKLTESGREESMGIAALRAEVFQYTETELNKLKENYRGVRTYMAEQIRNVVDRSNAEKQETVDLCRTLLNQAHEYRSGGGGGGGGDVGGADDIGTRYFQLQQKYNELQRNANHRADMLQKEIAELRQHVARSSPSGHLAFVSNATSSNDWEMTDYEALIDNIVGTEHADGLEESAGIGRSLAAEQYDGLQRYCTLKEQQYKETYSALKNDLDSLYRFFTDGANVDAAIKLAAYIHYNNIAFYSEYANLLKYLETLATSAEVRAYVAEANRYRAVEAVEGSGLIRQIVETSRTDIDNLSRTIVYSNAVVNELVAAMDNAYSRIVDVLGMRRFAEATVTPETLTDYFEQRFGAALVRGVTTLADRVAGLTDRVHKTEGENANLKTRLSDAAPPPQTVSSPTQTHVDRTAATAAVAVGPRRSDPHLNAFDGDPTVFEEVLQKVWIRRDADPLKRLLNAAYYALAIDRVHRYETSTVGGDLRLYNLVEYTVLTNYIKKHIANEQDARPELVNPRLNDEGYFLQHFINQLGNVQVENYVNTLDLRARNRLALILFHDYYVPVVNKAAFVMSIEGPFANFNMIYKV